MLSNSTAYLALLSVIVNPAGDCIMDDVLHKLLVAVYIPVSSQPSQSCHGVRSPLWMHFLSMSAMVTFTTSVLPSMPLNLIAAMYFLFLKISSMYYAYDFHHK